MTSAEETQIDIEKQKIELQTLDVQRIERDDLLRQKTKLTTEIAESKTTLSDIQSSIEKARATKLEDENKVNKDIEARLIQVKLRESAAADREEENRKIGQAVRKASEILSKKQDELNEQDKHITEREGNITKREKNVADQESAHESNVKVHETKVTAHKEAVKILNEREDKHAINLMHLVEDNKKVENEWTLIHKAHAEIDARTTIQESKETDLIVRSSGLDAREQGMNEYGQDLLKREETLAKNTKAITDREKTLAEIASNHDLREMEIKAKERALEKRERIIYLKEQQ